MAAVKRVGRAAWPILGIAVALLLLFGTAGCGDDDDDDGETFDPRQVVADAARQLAGAESFRFELTHENGSTEIIQDMQLTRAEGEVQRPDRLRADLEVTLLGQTLELEVVGVGERVWISNPFAPEQWQIVPDTTALEVLDLTALSGVLQALENPEAAGTGELDGQTHYRVTATVSSESLEPVIPAAAEPGESVDVEIWVGMEDGNTRRIDLQGPLNDDEDDDTERILRLSGFDEPVTIEPPE